MIWTKITIDTTCEAVDMLSYTLGELGVEGIEIEDKVPITEEEKKAMYIDFLPDLGEDDGLAKVTCYIDDPTMDVEELVHKISEEIKSMSAYMNVGSGRITLGKTEDKDWINNWKEFFKPFRIDDTIVIKPTWETLKDKKDTDLVIEMDPGTAFGTGAHHTTKLCIHQIRKLMKDDFRVLDAGSGSGILSIIANKLGASHVVGVDIDPIAVTASEENLVSNHIENEDVKFYAANIIDDPAKVMELTGKDYDLVVANILADVIIPLSAVVGQFMKPDGYFVSSGIINTKEEEVHDALLSNGFDIVETTYSGDWVSFTAQLKK